MADALRPDGRDGDGNGGDVGNVGDDRDTVRLLTRADELLGQLEATPGPTARTALDAVRVLTELYGEALARVMDAAGPELAGRLADDELVGHLLALHGIHPEPAEHRAARAVEAIRSAVRKQGGDVHLTGIEDGVATVRIEAAGCPSSVAGLAAAVREAVLALAPELSDVRRAPDEERRGAFVPLDAVRTRPLSAAGPA
ncbi:NifU family protein [Streptomyces sp. URMC 127]|uniref:NifU family protein n=1 Tax=Streptomyces sp. URMC 127 TaxID=3423402 RepID=UPI003F1CF08C